ncbi:MAG: ABC transporter permease [Thermoanaerobaculia bacterium]|nr:ABC transporter permease [Thermoanaerobaculia bacterium]
MTGGAVGVIVEKELRDLFQSPRFVVTFGIVSLLVLASFWLGGSHYLEARSEYDAARAEVLRQLEGETDWTNVEPIVHLPPSPMASLVSGIGHDVGRTAIIDPGTPVQAEASLYSERPLLALWRFLDLEFIFRVVLSLFAVLFAFDAISGEKERGTLRLALSNAVPRDVYVLGKMLGAFFGLAVPLLLPILGGCLLLLALGVPMASADWWRLATVVGAGFLYLAAFLGLSLLVSSRTHRASTSFLILLVIWIAAVLVMPRASVLAAGRWVEVPAVDADISQRSRLAAQLFRENREAMMDMLNAEEGGLRIELASETDTGDIEEPSPQEQAEAVAKFQARINEFLTEQATRQREALDDLDTRLAERRRNLEDRRRRMALGLSRTSPAATFSLAAMDLAGTSLDLPQRFAEQTLAYRNVFESFLREVAGGTTGGIRIVVRTDDQEEPPAPEPIDPSQLPEFQFDAPPLRTSLAGAAPDLGLLALFALLFYSGAFVSFLRYDVR